MRKKSSDMSGRWLVCLGGSQAKLPIVFAAKQRDMQVVVIDQNRNCSARTHADWFLPISITDTQVILKEFDRKGIANKVSFIFAYISHKEGLQSANYLAKSLSVPIYINDNLIEYGWNKIAFKQFCEHAGFQSPAYIHTDERDTIARFIQEYKTVVRKPVEGEGSADVIVTDSRQKIPVMSDASCFLEQYIEGDQYSYDAIAIRGNIVFSLVTRKHTDTDRKTISGFSINVPVQVKKHIVVACSAMAHAIDIQDGFFNFDVIMKNDSLYFIDVGVVLDCRIDVLLKYAGLDVYGFFLDAYMGVRRKPEKLPADIALAFIYPSREGRIHSLPVLTDDYSHITALHFDAVVGDICVLTGSISDQIGYVIGECVDWSKLDTARIAFSKQIIIGS
jgi:predicted ATP-grasp superfamily ATP-dependent carboligase